jgi:O-antigen ligase
MFVSSIIFGLFIYTGSNILKKLILLVIFSSLSLALFWTYSRAAYAALLVSVLITASFRGKRVLVATLVFLILFIFLLAPHAILERIYSSKIALLSPNYNESSVAYRVHQAKFALETVRQYPLFGIGLGARERVFYENQFIMFLSELGTVGFAAFFVLIFLIFKTALSLFRSAQNSLIKGFSAGYIAGLFGLLIECNTLVVFMISRIAMPFWLLTAILFWLGKEAKK